MKKKILCLILCFMFFALPSYGEDTLDVLYSYDENKITINADIGIANGDAAIYVLLEGINPNTMSDSVLPVAAEYTAANAGGKIVNYNMYLSNQLVFGNTYTVYVYYGTSGVLNASFSYLTLDDRIMNDIAASADWNSLRTVIMGTDDNGNRVNNYFGYISPDLTYYNQLNSKSQVFVNMYERKSELTDVSKIASLFLEISTDCYVSENTVIPSFAPSGGTSTSGGSYPIEKEAKPEPMPTEYFSDMKNHWARETVYAMAQRGIVNGFENGEFMPENPVTRAEFTKMTVCAFGLLRDAPNIFKDVEEGIWYEEYISAAASLGIVSGNGTSFYPNDKITREDAAVILYNTLNKIGTLESNTKVFDDNDSVSDYAEEAVSLLAGNHIISGTTELTFSPKKNTTRAEAATLIYRAYEYYTAR